ncbi:PepSY domain-containing protein [Thermaurantiacus sp.]
MERLILPALLLVAAPAAATGMMTCHVPRAEWRSSEALAAELVKQGWQVRKAKVDGGCYEVYGTTPEGDRVEAYFDPKTFEKLLVVRRGQILYRKPQ